MNCEKIKELLIEYVTGELDEATSSEVASHIESCAECKKEYEFLLGMSESIKVAEYEAPEELHDMIISAVKREARRESRAKITKKISIIAASAAAFVIVVNAVLFNPPKSEDPENNSSINGNLGSEDESNDMLIDADNVFTVSSGNAIYNDAVLSSGTAYQFAGSWECDLEDGTKVTMQINEDGSVVVCITDIYGWETYYDGVLTFDKNGDVRLSQSDGNVNCEAKVKMCIKDGRLLLDLVDGTLPWGYEL